MADSEAWTGQEILAAIRAWAERTGHPPGADDWRSATSNAQPGTRRVIRVFGSWNEAIATAGFVPTRSEKGRPTRRSGLFVPGS